MFKALVAEGVAEGAFDAGQARRLPTVEWFVFQGLSSYDPDTLASHDITTEQVRDNIIKFIINGIRTNIAREATVEADAVANQYSNIQK